MTAYIILYIVWICSCYMVTDHIKKWKYETPSRDDYIFTGLFILLAVIVLPACVLSFLINSLI